LDVISQGRANLGIGTGWYELEHDSLGYDFGTFTDRFQKLDESLQIILPMLAGERPTFSGKYYRTNEAMAEPRFRDHIPLMIGGSGEKKTCPWRPSTLTTSTSSPGSTSCRTRSRWSGSGVRRSAGIRARWKQARASP
jgi:hypothetical protein